MHPYLRMAILAMVGLGLSAGGPAAARGELIITVGNASIAQGGIGMVNVYIRSTDGTDMLDMSAVEFRLSSSGGTQVAFQNPPSFAHLLDPSYLYHGDSANLIIDPPDGWVMTDITDDDSYYGGDGTVSGTGVQVPMTDALLLRLEVTTLTSSPPQVGDEFSLTLILSGYTSFLTPETYDSLMLSDDSTLTGLITIIPADTPPPHQEVPEPGSLVLFALASVAGLYAHRRRQTRLSNAALLENP